MNNLTGRANGKHDMDIISLKQGFSNFSRYGAEFDVSYRLADRLVISGNLFKCHGKSKVKQSLYTPWRRLGGEEV
jgi:hypothetical protein